MAKNNSGLMSEPDPPKDSEAYCPQAPEDRQAPNYANDTPNNWLRGNGLKPGFDKHGAGR